MKRSKIVVKRFKFYLYGSVNPWVLLASGEVKHIDDELAQGKKIGDKLEVDGEIGRLIGKEDKRVTSVLGKDIGGQGLQVQEKLEILLLEHWIKTKSYTKN
ncbi:hypothetical protein DRF62_17530 [Chryseobacterium piscium]|jgi:hypothetical protein|uniref:Uncharacterized protein n=1 Tax=Chryseobacterium piscium TaxID=333702 RepID=A0A3D9BD65_9FLAO|nr:hypothetical protein [Chryseobacterium piscium]REC51318.1 hypothetical protein DRF62_17530 [Chryseobacterium piscium]